MSVPEKDAHQTLTDHLSELRDRLIRSMFAIFACMLVGWFFSDQIFDAIRAPILPYLPEGGLIFTNPMDKFLAHVKLALVTGIVISCPFWFYQAWMFVAPGLYTKEKKFATMFITSGTVLFLVGVSFAYFLVFPTAFKFLLNFGGTVDKPFITISEYVSFFSTTTLVFGAAFELPLAITILGILGIVDQKFLREKRRYAVVLLAVVSAIITPPDALSMLMLLVPMYLLYEISIILVGFFARKRMEAADAHD